MLEELRPIGLRDVARDLGIDPFEVVRLLVVADAFPERLEFTADHVEQIRKVGGIEHWWTEGWPEERRELILDTVRRLIDGGIHGDRGTRVDNLWRGLPTDEQALLQQLVTSLVQSGHLATFMTPRGVQVSLTSTAVDTLKQVVAGETELGSISALW